MSYVHVFDNLYQLLDVLVSHNYRLSIIIFQNLQADEYFHIGINILFHQKYIFEKFGNRQELN